MGWVAPRPPAAALGVAGPWGVVGAWEAGPGQVTQLGAGRAWGAGQRLGYWAAMAAGAERCAKLEGYKCSSEAPTDPSLALLFHPDPIPVLLSPYLPQFPTTTRIRTVAREVYRIGSSPVILPCALCSLPSSHCSHLHTHTFQVSEQVSDTLNPPIQPSSLGSVYLPTPDGELQRGHIIFHLRMPGSVELNQYLLYQSNELPAESIWGVLCNFHNGPGSS